MRVLAGEVLLSQLQRGFAELTASTEGAESIQETPSHIHLTEGIEKEDPRSMSSALKAARKAEFNGLRARKTWSVVKIDSIPLDANIICGRFVNILKNVGRHEETAKARYVGQGFKDQMKPFLVHNNPTLRQSSTKIIVSVAAVKGFRISLLDVTQAYLQAKDKFSREILS